MINENAKLLIKNIFWEMKKWNIERKATLVKTHLRMTYHLGRNQKVRYENCFNGYCFSCYEFGHKALQCKSYYQRRSRRSNHFEKCLRCNFHGHNAAYCHAMKCYNWNGFGHKAQECWYSRRHTMGYTSFNNARRDVTVKAPWKNSKNQDYSQKGINMNT